VSKEQSPPGEDSQPPKSGLWRVVSEAIESNIKTTRLIFILGTLALLALAIRPRG
jgi:hypothetical protein